MWIRFLNVFSTGWSAWGLALSPAQFFIGIFMLLAAPYLMYIFWGSVVLFILLGASIGWLIYRFIKKRKNRL